MDGAREDLRRFLRRRRQVTVNATLAKQATLVERPAIEVAKYVGRFGWVTITIRKLQTLDLTPERIDRSYDRLAPKSKVRGRSR